VGLSRGGGAGLETLANGIEFGSCEALHRAKYLACQGVIKNGEAEDEV